MRTLLAALMLKGITECVTLLFATRKDCRTHADEVGCLQHFLANGVKLMQPQGSDNVTRALDFSNATIVTNCKRPLRALL